MVVTIFFFGPILSRRLGSSLGIDLLPKNQKNCTLNCRYCEIGATRPITCNKRFKYYPGSISEFKVSLERIIESEYPSSLTFVGYLGEPTLNEAIYEFLDATNEILANLKNDTAIPTILSNSTTITDPIVQKNIIRFKRIIMKLDAGEQETFKTLNQPHSSVPNVDIIINNLAILRKHVPPNHQFILQTLLTNENSNKKNLDALVNAFNAIKPSSIQLYSISRPPAYQLIRKISNDELKRIKKYLERDLNNSIKINVY
ncbi:MAG: radical SAM protein [Candidatus Helarchaeota archaeon]